MSWSHHLRRGLFVLLLAPVVSVLTAMVVSATGVGKDQGLAGPATALVWAAFAALIAFVAGIFLARRIAPDRLVRINVGLAVLALLVALYVGFRISRQASPPSPADPPRATRSMSWRDSGTDRSSDRAFL